MKNVSILLVGGDLDGQTYTAREDEKILHIHNSEVKDVVTDVKVHKERAALPKGHMYVYEQESEGSNRFVYVKTEG
jgi:hypothetical protein